MDEVVPRLPVREARDVAHDTPRGGRSRARGRHAAWILAVSLAAGALTFLVFQLRPVRYGATATVRIRPLVKAAGGNAQGQASAQDLLGLAGAVPIGFDAYRALALSPSTLKATLARLPDPPAGLGPDTLARHLSLAKVSGGGATPLLLRQSVADRDPRLAAALANAWARASTAAVSASIAGELADLHKALASKVVTASDAVDAAQATWSAFQSNDRRSSLRAQLSALDTRIAAAQQRLDALQRDIAAAKGSQRLVQAVLQARRQGGSADLTSQVGALASAGVIDPTLAADLTRALAAAPGGRAQSPQDAATVVARTRLQRQAAALAGYVAERTTTQKQLASFVKTQAQLRSELAGEQSDAARLQRQLDAATAAYQRIASLTPLVDAAGTLAGDTATVLAQASVPARAPGRRTLSALVAALTAGLLALLTGVLLRAALAGQRLEAAVPDARPDRAEA